MNVRIFGVILLLALVATVAASADVLTPAVPYVYQAPTPYTNLTGTWPETFNVTQFNPSLGSLQYVIIKYQGAWAGAISVTNNDEGPEDLQGQQFISLGLQDASSNQIFVMNSNSVVHDFGTVAGGGGTAGPFDWSGNSGGLQTEDYTTNLAAWEGAGTVPLTGTFGGYGEASGGVDMSAQTSGTAGEYFTVQYDYSTSVPEPGTLGLGAMCLLGLGFWRRRKR